MLKARRHFDKIIQTIDSSSNELHLRTCSNMIAMFSMRFIDEEDQERVSRFELELKNALDIKAVKLGLLIV